MARYGTPSATANVAGSGSAMLGDAFGPTFYVNTTASATGNGKNPNHAFLTMAEAFAAIATLEAQRAHSADNTTIYWEGVISEQLTTPLSGESGVGVSGLRIVALVNGNNHHDDGARWTVPASPTAATPLLTIRGQGCVIDGGIWVGDATNATSCIMLRRAESATYPDASHTIIRNIRFFGAYTGGAGVIDSGGNSQITIEDCIFEGLTEGIGFVTGAGIAAPNRYVISNNIFRDNTDHIDLPCDMSVIQWNVMDEATVNIDVGGGLSGGNTVNHNAFANAQANIKIADGYIAGTGDIWEDNYATDAADYGVPD